LGGSVHIISVVTGLGLGQSKRGIGPTAWCGRRRSATEGAGWVPARGPATVPPVQIVSWNINSIRARVAQVIGWLDENRPEVCCLQETKCPDGIFPHESFAAIGYEVAHHGVDHWNGVAIASRVGLSEVARGFTGPQRPPFDEPRVIAAGCGGVRVWSIYAPNGRELDDPHYLYKLVWFERLRAELITARAASGSSVVVGDFNVAPGDIDIYDPKRWKRRTHASPPERAALSALCDLGLQDLARCWSPEEAMFTWWNYRANLEGDRGLRIDLALGSAEVLDRLSGVRVDRSARAATRPSDHAPLVVSLAETDPDVR
jgi:exodeoxyribonuclease III